MFGKSTRAGIAVALLVVVAGTAAAEMYAVNVRRIDKVDRPVAIREVTNYVATLKTQGSPVTLLVEPDGGHSPVEPVPREAYLFAMETMLQRHLGGPVPEPPGQRLRAYLRENLRLAGPEFMALVKKRATP